jgi:hypothetical protein
LLAAALRGFRPLSLLLAVSACSGARADTSSPPEIRLAGADRHVDRAHVDVVGLEPADLETLRARARGPGSWNAVLTVTVAGAGAASDTPTVAGSHTVDDTSIRFTPSFPFDPGRLYDVRFDPRSIGGSGSGGWRHAPVVARVGLPKRESEPTARVVEVSPTGRVPENLLRMYVRFSEPMGLGGGLPHIRLTTADGREVVDPFVPLDQALWNADRTRFTLLFDPGRVKTGILPNQQMGRPLHAGKKYFLEVDADWRDAQGRPLAAPFRRALEVGPEILQGLDLSAWRLTTPASGSRDALVVRFPWALDRALVERVLAIEGADGTMLTGTGTVSNHETEWGFVPRDAWQAGAYQLVALNVLEDPSGNRIGRPFEINPPPTAVPIPERVTRAFTVK